MGDIDGVDKKEWYVADLKVVMSQIHEQESVLRLKRRWLMDLPLSSIESRRVEELLPLTDNNMPERLLREDDVGYEHIRSCVEGGFGVHSRVIEDLSFRGDLQELKQCNNLKDMFKLLDDLSNKGLCLACEILSGGTIKSEKTNQSMKGMIKQLLPKVFADKSCVSQTKIHQCLQLLKEPENFRRDKAVLQLTASEAYRAAALEVLEKLDEFPLRTLRAMHRKVRDVKGYVPEMQYEKSGKRRDQLSRVVKKRCMKMLSGLGKTDVPGEPLSGALAVADLSLKLVNHQSSLRTFKIFSPEVLQLQNDIAKAIHLLDNVKKVSLIELKQVQVLLDPGFKLSVKNLRTGVRNLLTEYLFECSNMDKVPDVILETLDVINRRSRSSNSRKQSTRIYSSPQEYLKTEIENEVECVLAVSAQAKEIVIGQLPEHEFDKDFAQAYKEDFGSVTLSVSDDEDGVVYCDDFSAHGASDLAESIGEIDPRDLGTHMSTMDKDDCSSVLSCDMRSAELAKSITIARICSDISYGFDHSLNNEETEVDVQLERECTSECARKLEFDSSDSCRTPRKQNSRSQSQSPVMNSGNSYLKGNDAVSCYVVDSKVEYVEFEETEAKLGSQHIACRNQYLEVQEACDQTSMVTYRFVGRVLEMLAQTEGLELYHGDRSYLCSNSSVSEEFPGEVSASNFRRLWKDVLDT